MPLETLEDVSRALERCNRCGFCQAECPIYKATGIEWNTARGRLTLLRDFLEGKLDSLDDLKKPIFDCLTCNSCLEHCPPGVDTAHIMIKAREHYAKEKGQSWLKRMIFERLLVDYNFLGACFGAGRLAQGLRLDSLLVSTGVAQLGGSPGKALDLLPRLPAQTGRRRVEAIVRRSPHSRGRVAYFIGCAANFAFPQVAESTARLLQRNHLSVMLRDFVCCGKPAEVYGDLMAAREMARKNIDAIDLSDVDAIVTPCASCSSFLKEYADLMASDPQYAARAQDFVAKVRDFSELLTEVGGTPELQAVHRRVTYHDPCHLGRFQKITAQPRNLIKAIPGLQFVEMAGANICCGAAGSFVLTNYDLSMQVLSQKMANVAETEADILVTSCPACVLQLSYGARKENMSVQVMELTSLLDEACRI